MLIELDSLQSMQYRCNLPMHRLIYSPNLRLLTVRTRPTSDFCFIVTSLLQPKWFRTSRITGHRRTSTSTGAFSERYLRVPIKQRKRDRAVMFERTLQDLIRGLRSHKGSSKAQEDAFLAEAMDEIREELRGKDMALKAEGILKMCYVSLQALARRQ